jgi:cAMP phosphodiesterase
MKVKVLGCSGSETIGHNPPGFLVNDTVMLDAGTITAALTLTAQTKLTDVLISHPHLDHVKSVLFLADNIIGRIKQPVNIRALPKVIEAIKKHLMNNIIWPDFTRIPTPKNPVLTYKPFQAGKELIIAGLRITPVPMNHPVPAVGFLVNDGKASILYTADTGPNEGIWKEAAKAKNLKAIIVDTSFPDKFEALADVSGHFTPIQLHRDLEKANVHNSVPIYVYHVKPAYEAQVLRDLRALGRKNIKILREGKSYTF